MEPVYPKCGACGESVKPPVGSCSLQTCDWGLADRGRLGSAVPAVDVRGLFIAGFTSAVRKT